MSTGNFEQELDYGDKNLISSKISNFFDQASIYVPNKFHVILYGKYIGAAINEMIANAQNISDSALSTIQQSNLSEWMQNHYLTSGGNETYVSLKWTCKNVSLPTANAVLEEDFILDTIKNIRYPLIKEPIKTQTVSMTILEDRKMMMYQFLNSLNNQFYNTLYLKPTSSFHKLSIVVIPILQNEDDTTSYNKNSIYAIPGQVFEFNSAVLQNLGDIKLGNDNNKPQEYNISFKVPNSFQSAFETDITGLKDNTSDITLIDPQTGISKNKIVDSSVIGTFDPNLSNYNISSFEQNPTTLNLS